jgi:hypothetical protein
MPVAAYLQSRAVGETLCVEMLCLWILGSSVVVDILGLRYLLSHPHEELSGKERDSNIDSSRA